MHLQIGTNLQSGDYIIEKVLGQGGFGITYLATQARLERKVALKEFFMVELCERDKDTSHVTLGTQGSKDTVTRFRDKFLKEARNIAKLNHPNIVRVIDIFEENGTAYYVMEYAENGSLADKVNREGYLSEPLATRYIKQVAEALGYIHSRKMNHLDVKPGNIMLDGNDNAILIDFGLSKQYDATTGNQTSTTPVGISEGYAPMEQYKQGGVGEFSPETDIYALGATFFKLLTGEQPPCASDINEDGVPVNELQSKGVSQASINTICKAMESRKKMRMNNAEAFINELNATTQQKQEKQKDKTIYKKTDLKDSDETVIANNNHNNKQESEDSEVDEAWEEEESWMDKIQNIFRKRNVQIGGIILCTIVNILYLLWVDGGINWDLYNQLGPLPISFIIASHVYILSTISSTLKIKSKILWATKLTYILSFITLLIGSSLNPFWNITILIFFITSFIGGIITCIIKTNSILLKTSLFLFSLFTVQLFCECIFILVDANSLIDLLYTIWIPGHCLYAASFFIFMYCIFKDSINPDSTEKPQDLFYDNALTIVSSFAIFVVITILVLLNQHEAISTQDSNEDIYADTTVVDTIDEYDIEAVDTIAYNY